MSDIEKMAWRMAENIDYQPATFWGELDTEDQDYYVAKAKEVLESIKQNVFNGNWTTAIETVVKYSGVKMEMLAIPNEHKISLADYVIEELRKC